MQTFQVTYTDKDHVVSTWKVKADDLDDAYVKAEEEAPEDDLDFNYVRIVPCVD